MAYNEIAKIQTKLTQDQLEKINSIPESPASTEYVNEKYEEANSWWTGFIQGGYNALVAASVADNYTIPPMEDWLADPTLATKAAYAISYAITLAAKPEQTITDDNENLEEDPVEEETETENESSEEINENNQIEQE